MYYNLEGEKILEKFIERYLDYLIGLFDTFVLYKKGIFGHSNMSFFCLKYFLYIKTHRLL